MLASMNSAAGNLHDRSRRLLEELLPTDSAQVFFIDASRESMLVSASGIRFIFHSFGFQDFAGNDVTGEVQIQIKEILQKGEMMRSNRMTTSEDRLLESAGQFCIEASQEGVPLQLSLPIAVEMPVTKKLTNPLAARLYTGSLSGALTTADYKVFDWKLLVNRKLNVKNLNGKKYYSFYLTELNWFACSHLQSRRVTRTMVSARCISPIDDFEEQVAFLVFKNFNAIARMYPGFNRFTALNVPVKQAAEVVIIGFRQGTWFYGTYPIEKTASQIVAVNLAPIAEVKLLEYLRKL